MKLCVLQKRDLSCYIVIKEKEISGTGKAGKRSEKADI